MEVLSTREFMLKVANKFAQVQGHEPITMEEMLSEDPEVTQAMEDSYNEFATMHVEAALQAASKAARVLPNYSSKSDDPEDRRHQVSPKSILNAYPVDKIK